MYIVLSVLILIAIFFLIFFHWRKRKIIKKICCMSTHFKCRFLNELVEPLGYSYNARQDIFTTTEDAWQKNYGYGAVYDQIAPHLNMIFDCHPVYFDYDGKTWLVEFWKGQYGINTGSEIGVYHADSIIPPAARKLTIFTAASEDEYLDMSTELKYKGHPIGRLSAPHWWLTIFSMGKFSNPKDLSLGISIRFPDLDMRDAFLDALIQSGYDLCSIRVCFTTVSFKFTSTCCRLNLLKRIFRCYVQFKNRLFCKIFRFITRPFRNSCDKLLYLYYYLPFIFQRTFRLKRFKKKFLKGR